MAEVSDDLKEEPDKAAAAAQDGNPAKLTKEQIEEDRAK